MRYSMVKAATVAILGLGNIFLGVNAFPNGVTEIQDRSVSHENFKLAARTKAVPKLGDYGYEAVAGLGFPNKPLLYVVTKKGHTETVNQIRIDKTANSITVTNAENANDKLPPKLFLSDIQMSLFVYKGGKTASDLAILSYEMITEAITQPVIEEAFKKLGKKNTEIITVTPLSTGLEKEVFDDLKKTTFGKNSQRLHDDFGSGLPKKFVLSAGWVQGTLTVHLK